MPRCFVLNIQFLDARGCTRCVDVQLRCAARMSGPAEEEDMLDCNVQGHSLLDKDGHSQPIFPISVRPQLWSFLSRTHCTATAIVHVTPYNVKHKVYNY